MKRNLIIGIVIGLSLLFLLGTTQFNRAAHTTRVVFKIDVPQMTVANGSSDAVTDTVDINGIVRSITVGINDNTGNKTATVSLVDSEGSILFTTDAIAEDTDTAPVSQMFMTCSGTDLPLLVPCNGTITVKATPSGDPGASGMTIDVTLYGD